MKRIGLVVFLLAGIVLFAAAFAAAESKDDMQVIKKAVKDNPDYEPGKEVKWFKVLVTDTESGKEKVKVTLPISLVDVFAKCAHDKHIHIDDHECDINLGELMAELKKIGPMAFIEVYEDDETIKVWLE